MSTNSLLLAETLPQSIVTALGELPNRLLFQNSCIQLVLAGLKPGQELKNFQPPAPLLMTVTFGNVWVRTEHSMTQLVEGESFTLEPNAIYQVRAWENSDLLFFIPSAKKTAARSPLIKAIPFSALALS